MVNESNLQVAYCKYNLKQLIFKIFIIKEREEILNRDFKIK